MAKADTKNTSQITRLDNGNIDIKLTLAWAEIQKAYESQVEKSVSEAEISGFRKGKAPRDIVEPKLDKSAIMSKAIGDLLPEKYAAAVKEANIKPVLYPQIRIDKGENGQDFEFTATTCELPAFELPDYKEAAKKLTPKEGESAISAILDHIRKVSPLKIPDILVEEESNHRLSALAENLTQLGLDMQKYLQTKKMTAEDLKAQTAASSRIELEVELILSKIQETEKLADRTKTLDFLKGLIPEIKA